MGISEKFPPLYECSVCGNPVKVTSQGIGIEPLYEYDEDCPHRGVTIYAKRKVTLRGKGELNMAQSAGYKITLTIRQFLSMITGRSI
jgi:nitrate/nitrite-specific signal transduction histidine kinase